MLILRIFRINHSYNYRDTLRPYYSKVQTNLLTKSKKSIPPFHAYKITMIHVMTESLFVGDSLNSKNHNLSYDVKG